MKLIGRMEKLFGTLRILPREGSQKKEIAFVPEKQSIEVGSNIDCDIRMTHEDVSPIHFKIYLHKSGKVRTLR